MLIEVNCETDFVARTDEFQKLVRDLAMQVAGLGAAVRGRRPHPRGRPRWRRRRRSLADESVAGEARERSARRSSRASSAKWYKEVCLLEQPFRDEDRTVRDLVTEKIATIGENIRVRRFVRYALGEEM